MSENIKVTTITEEELALLPNQLMMLPFCMRLLGHKTIEGHHRYVHGSRAYEIYLKWFGNQSQENWDDIVALWGGEDVYREIQRSMVNKTSSKITENLNA